MDLPEDLEAALGWITHRLDVAPATAPRGFVIHGPGRVWIEQGPRSLPEARRLALDLLGLPDHPVPSDPCDVCRAADSAWNDLLGVPLCDGCLAEFRRWQADFR